MSESSSLWERAWLPTVGLAVGTLLGGLVGAAIGSWTGNEVATIVCYLLGFLGGAAAGSLLGRKWHMRRPMLYLMPWFLLAGGSLLAADLQSILESQPEEVQARYTYRHPGETLEFFGLKPGMTVVEVLPGDGWYTKILLPYLGPSGGLIGADYPLEMWPKFGLGEDLVKAKRTWVEDWTAEAETWRGDDSARVSAFVLNSLPDKMAGTADAVLFIRALHNLNRFESDGGFLTAALNDTYRVLKPGGVVGIVQHRARNDKSDDWADGSRGYLKKDYVVRQMEKAGFELMAESDMHANPADQPDDNDVVWRLPPSLQGGRDDPEVRARMEAIGESNRMTLKFRKPE